MRYELLNCEGTMAKIPSKVANRISSGIKKFQPILERAKLNGVGESDTVTIVMEMLAEIFGYDKFLEITSEHAIKGNKCDLAIKIDGEIGLIVEVKAIGINLNEQHVTQAVNYAVNIERGVEWVIVTNGMNWRVYKVIFAKPIDQDLVIEINFAPDAPKNAKDVEVLYLFSKEGWLKRELDQQHKRTKVLGRFFLGAIIRSDPVLDVVRKILRKVSPEVRIDIEEIKSELESGVIRRDVLEGDKADEAQKKMAKVANKIRKAKQYSGKADSSVETCSGSGDVLDSSLADIED